jgi:hypothetical protein
VLIRRPSVAFPLASRLPREMWVIYRPTCY